MTKYTALHLAVLFGDLVKVKEMIMCGADLRARISDGDTPLHLAARSGNLDIVKELIRCGAVLGARSRHGNTPLMWAVIYADQTISQFLVKKMTVRDLSVVDDDGWNVLHYMVGNDRPWSNVILDINNRCPHLLKQKSRYGHRPIDIARDRRQGVYKILVQMEQRQRRRRQQQYMAGISDSVENPCNITITVVGHHGVGKSCFVRQLNKESIPEGGPGSTDTADFYIKYIGYNPITGFRQNLDKNGEIETGRQRLKRIVDRYRKEDKSAVQPSDDRSAPHQIKEVASAENPDIHIEKEAVEITKEIYVNKVQVSANVLDLYDQESRSASSLDLRSTTSHLSTVDVDVFSTWEKRGIKQNLKRVSSLFRSHRQDENQQDILQDQSSGKSSSSDAQHDKLPPKQSNEDPISLEEKKLSEIPIEQKQKIEEIPIEQVEEIPIKPKKKLEDKPIKPKKKLEDKPIKPKNKLKEIPIKQNKNVEEIPIVQKKKVEEIPIDPKKELKNIPMKQKGVIEAVMLTKTDGDGDEEVKGYVTIYDFGGEKVFYNTHHCFMSSNMVFVLVFDVAMCLDPERQKDGYERIEFWLRSIATYAIDSAAHGKGSPPIILVGSHLDLLSQDKDEQRHLFASVLEKLREKPELGEIMENHVHEMFPVADLNDSTKNQGVYQQMWEKIIEIAPLQSQWMKPVPARWVAFEHELVRLKNEDRVILTYADLLEVNKELAVPLAKDDIKNFLWKLRFFGSFLCFDLYSKKPFIVLQAQWIINAFKSIITDPKFLTELSIKQRDDWTAYEKSGILPVKFIRQLWGRCKEFRFLENEAILCIVLETLGLLSKPLSVDTDVNYFIVPSILQNADPEIIRPILDDPDTVTTVAICLKFDNPFIPQAVWDKMIAACIHRFQRLDELGMDGSKFIQRGFVCLSVDFLWNMVINCCNNCMKMTMFKKDTDHSVPAGTGINLLSILEFLLRRILELNHQSHLRYQFYLHNDYRFTIKEKMVKVDDLRQTPRLQCRGLNGYRWIDRDEIYIWFKNPNQKTILPRSSNVDLETLPDRKLSFKEVGRVSRYIGSTYQTFFAELDCPIALVEQEMEEHRHLAFRSRITKIFIHLLKTKPGTGFLAIADAMSRHGMDPTLLVNILDSNRNMTLRDDTYPDEWLQKNLSGDDVPIIANHVDIKSYFNLFLELGFTPNSIDEFDDHYRNKGTRKKIIALLEAFITETDPRPTVKTILLATQECDMDTESLTEALNPPSWVFQTKF